MTHSTSTFVQDDAQAGLEPEDIGTNRDPGVTLNDVIATRFSRRDAFKGLTASLALTAFGGAAMTLAREAKAAVSASTLTFAEVPHGYTPNHVVAEGYDAQILIRWGDPVLPGAPAFDPRTLTADDQEKMFGYNNDYVGFLPLPLGSKNADHGLLCVNHEYTNVHLMFPGLKEGELSKLTKEQVDIEMAAHGHSVIEIKRGAGGKWAVVPNSPYNRRLSLRSTAFTFDGPAAGHDRLKTKTDATGAKVIGTINNCAGGKTPWGTVLIAEENFNNYFGGKHEGAEADNLKRLGFKEKADYAFYLHHERFDVSKDPNEANKFGWMVELDPFDPKSTPVKHTALGHFKHEGANVVVNKDGRVVAYAGDDERFEFVYRFVSKNTYDPNNREANKTLLSEGTLSVAKFEADGKLVWLPLVFGQGPLTEANGFKSQADVLIETRKAAKLVGATPMDRPEDVEPNPVTGVVYMALTNNSNRKDDQVDAANPRARNLHGHIVEMIPPGTSPSGKNAEADHTADAFTWDIFLLAGDPAKDGAKYNAGTSADGWFSSPDNVAFDSKGRLWIATDGFTNYGSADGTWAADTSGSGRALTRAFFRCPMGAENCGPEFNPDDTAYFLAVQHPGDDKNSTFDAPSTRWPDFQDALPPRPSVVVVSKKGGGPIGA
jgi:uncharacterized protein